MKTLTRASVVLTLLLCSATASYGQCSQLQAMSVQCGGPNNCVQSVPINQPIPAEYGFYLDFFPVYCCSTHFYSYTEGGNCEGTHEYAPIAKAPLAAAASLQPLLIRNCAGGYDPYVQQPTSHFDIMRSLNSSARLTLN